MMKQRLQQCIDDAVAQLITQGKLQQPIPQSRIEVTKNQQHGDYSSNAALLLAKQAQCSPRQLAATIIRHITPTPAIDKIELAGPGFINFHINATALHALIPQIITAGDRYGYCTTGKNQRVNIEFVSSNPTGPLHVGHGRGAVVGSVLANIFEAIGYTVQREYYVNDAGRQMDILTVSVWLRYLEQQQNPLAYPKAAYHGDYIRAIATQLQANHQQQFYHDLADTPLPADEDGHGHGDKEAHIDAIIAKAKQCLGEAFTLIKHYALTRILTGMQQDLKTFGVEFDCWFSEASLWKNTQAFEQLLQPLRDQGYIYQQQGAVWFKTSALGDDKDRVLIRANGQSTYFASDILYHYDKLKRGNQLCIDVLGADHHGYVARIKAALKALGYHEQQFHASLLQLVSLYRHGELLAMSTRTGEYVTLRQLYEEVGCDAARFFYIMRRSEQTIDFDLDLAKAKNKDNPIYYIHYAHARICSVLRQLTTHGYPINTGPEVDLSPLTNEQEYALLQCLARYQETLATAAKQFEPCIIANYLREIASLLHSYYNSQHIIVADSPCREARVQLLIAVKQVIKNGLRLLGITALEHM